jgi:hypothetical protein
MPHCKRVPDIPGPGLGGLRPTHTPNVEERNLDGVQG